MAATFNNLKIVCFETLRLLHNKLSFAMLVGRQYNDKFAQDGAKGGEMVDVRMTPRYKAEVTKTSQANPFRMTSHDYAEPTLQIKVDTIIKQKIEMNDLDRTLRMDDWQGRVLEPFIADMANAVDMELGDVLCTATPYYVGTPGEAISDTWVFTNAHTWLDWNMVPDNEQRNLVISPDTRATAVHTMQALFNSQAIVARQMVTAKTEDTFGWNWKMNQNVPRHTVGSFTTAGRVNGAAQMVSAIDAEMTLDTDGWSGNATLLKGDVFTIAGVYHVNPMNRRTTNRLQPFVVLEDDDATSGGVMAGTKIWPPIIPSGNYQTVTSAPADNALLTVWGGVNAMGNPDASMSGRNFPQSLGFHRDFGTMVSVDLVKPSDGTVPSFQAADPTVGMSVSIINSFDANDRVSTQRADSLCGFNSLRRDHGVRIVG